MTDHDKAPHEELLARLDEWRGYETSGIHAREMLQDIADAAAAIRSLQAKLEAAESYFSHECETSSLHLQRAIAAEQALAKCDEAMLEGMEEAAKILYDRNCVYSVEIIRAEITRRTSAQTQPK